jgi:hypothetical protein
MAHTKQVLFNDSESRREGDEEKGGGGGNRYSYICSEHELTISILNCKLQKNKMQLRFLRGLRGALFWTAGSNQIAAWIFVIVFVCCLGLADTFR